MTAATGGSLPHLVASAVVLDASHLFTLLVRSGDQHRWQLVTGHVTGGEPIAEAARREIRDQTGLVGVRVVEPHLGVQQDLVDCGTGATLHVDQVFLAVSNGLAPADGSDAEAAGWFSVSALPSPMAPGVGLQVRAALRLAERDGGQR